MLNVGTSLMNSGSAATTDYELYPNWLPTGVWQGTLSGGYYGDGSDGLGGQGGGGEYWSSTAYGTDIAYNLFFLDGDILPTGDGDSKSVSNAVRCAI